MDKAKIKRFLMVLICVLVASISQEQLQAFKGQNLLQTLRNQEQVGLFSTNGPSASLIYCVDGNRIYGYDFQNGDEYAIRPQALPESAYISYVSDQTFDGVEYFVVGIQSGDKYTLYFYNVLGGQPDGQPVYEVSGSGVVKSVHYTRAGYDTLSGSTPQVMD